MQNNMERFRETFFEEAAEHLANMESALLGLEHSPGDQELLNNIFRSPLDQRSQRQLRPR